MAKRKSEVGVWARAQSVRGLSGIAIASFAISLYDIYISNQQLSNYFLLICILAVILLVYIRSDKSRRR